MFPLNTAIGPGVTLPLHIFEPRYRALVHDLLENPEPHRRQFGMIALRDGHEIATEGISAFHEVGVIVGLRHAEMIDDGRFNIVVRGEQRFRLLALDASAPLLRAQVEPMQDPDLDVPAELAAAVARDLARYASRIGLPDAQTASIEAAVGIDANAASYGAAAMLVIPSDERQRLLEANDAVERLSLMRMILAREIGLIEALRAIPALDPHLTEVSMN